MTSIGFFPSAARRRTSLPSGLLSLSLVVCCLLEFMQGSAIAFRKPVLYFLAAIFLWCHDC